MNYSLNIAKPFSDGKLQEPPIPSNEGAPFVISSTTTGTIIYFIDMRECHIIQLIQQPSHAAHSFCLLQSELQVQQEPLRIEYIYQRERYMSIIICLKTKSERLLRTLSNSHPTLGVSP
jgi:hypothetical protein